MSEQTPIVRHPDEDDDLDGNRSRTYSARQRIVVVTFGTADLAKLFDGLPDDRALAWMAERSICAVDRPDRKGP